MISDPKSDALSVRPRGRASRERDRTVPAKIPHRRSYCLCWGIGKGQLNVSYRNLIEHAPRIVAEFVGASVVLGFVIATQPTRFNVVPARFFPRYLMCAYPALVLITLPDRNHSASVNCLAHYRIAFPMILWVQPFLYPWLFPIW